MLKYLLQLLYIGFTIARASTVPAVSPQRKIIGGYLTTIEEVPYLVYMNYNNNFLCGGSLVAPQYVVSAAHCVKDRLVAKFEIVAGSSYLNGADGVRQQVKRILYPKEYNANTYEKDFSVLQLAGKIYGPNISTIPICSNPIPTGDIIKVSGWGTTESGQVSNQVRSVEMPVISNGRCQQLYGKRAVVDSGMFCAMVPNVKDACFGDSGGPLVYNNQLCGIVSWGIGCARADSPGVYTNVTFKANTIVKMIVWLEETENSS